MTAHFSPCRTWRYRLDRPMMYAGPTVCIFGVNPSTADESTDDATIRKDLGFGERHKWGRLIKGNKFAFCATDVRELATAKDPVGPENNSHLLAMMAEADILIGAWGPLAKLPPRLRRRWRTLVMLSETVRKPIMCFGVAKDGQPRHTLMLAYDTPLITWERPRFS